MSSLVQDDFVRATTFFALAFGLMTLGGLVIGDVRTGLEWGVGLGVAFGVFAYLFVRPTATEGTEGTAAHDGSVRPEETGNTGVRGDQTDTGDTGDADRSSGG